LSDVQGFNPRPDRIDPRANRSGRDRPPGLKTLPLPARVLVASMIAGAAALLLLLAEWPPIDRLPGFLAVMLAAVLTSAFKLHLPTTKNRATLSASFVIDFVSLLMFGAHATVLVAAAGALSQSTLGGRRRNPPHRTLFNIACFIVTIEATGFVYHLFGGSVGALAWPSALTPLAAAATTYFLANSGLVALVISLSTAQPSGRVWRQNFLWSGPSYFIGAAVATALAEAVERGLWGFVPVAAIPAYLTYRAYAVYAGRLEDEHRHREIIESLNEGMSVIDRDSVVTLWNDALERITGCDRERAEGRPLLEIVPVLAGTELREAIDAALTRGEPEVLNDFTLVRDTGRRLLQIRVFPYVGGATLFWSDITARAEAELALKRSEERYALAASGANDGLWDWDLVSGEIHFSPRWRSMTGLPGAAAAGRPEEWFERVHKDDVASLKAALEAHMIGQTEHFRHEHRLLHGDGSYRWVLSRGAAVRHADGSASRIAGSLTDVTERVRVQEQLRRAALHDALTGLPNRALFVELLGQTLDAAKRRPERQCAVLFLDIDRFKVINDSLGHQIGDELLVAISRRLQSCLRDGDALARLGGDEFTVLLHDVHGSDQAKAIAQRIQGAIQAPLSLGGREIVVSASIGIALSVADYRSPHDIMRDADSAMYRAKTGGKARHELFDAEMHAQALDRLEFENDLRHAVARKELTLNYQPIVSLASGRSMGFEALLRWERGGRPVPPAAFIPVAEEIGLMEPLGAWVLQEACRQFAEWQKQFPHDVMGIAVNVSAGQLAQPNFISIVLGAVREAGLTPGDLRLEITETTVLRSPEVVEAVLLELRALGVKTYLDDFGTGFSSLSHLHRLPVDALKIDRSFVESLTDRCRPAIVESILALARTIGTDVIAEGVETEDQLLELVRLGCAQAQGFLFSSPLPASAVEAFLAGSTSPARRDAAAPVRQATTGRPRSSHDTGATRVAVVH
jgi:diguanylate cyclase (GGDEF)-like protein/PAS domain S-box-containing protein